MSDFVSRARAVSFALAARPFFWGADYWVARRDRDVWRAWRLQRAGTNGLRWSDYDSVHAARAAGLDLSAVTWGETPLASARALLQRAGVDDTSAVLDLGAGSGTFLLAARSLKARARGVELVRSRVLCGAGALAVVDAVLEQGDARTASLTAPWTPTHVVLAWTTWPAALRAAVGERLSALPPHTRVLSFTHALPTGFNVVKRDRAITLSGALDVMIGANAGART